MPDLRMAPRPRHTVAHSLRRAPSNAMPGARTFGQQIKSCQRKESNQRLAGRCLFSRHFVQPVEASGLCAAVPVFSPEFSTGTGDIPGGSRSRSGRRTGPGQPCVHPVPPLASALGNSRRLARTRAHWARAMNDALTRRPGFLHGRAGWAGGRRLSAEAGEQAKTGALFPGVPVFRPDGKSPEEGSLARIRRYTALVNNDLMLRCNSRVLSG